MINVEITPFGRHLMVAMMGAIKLKATIVQNQTQQLQTQIKNIQEQREQVAQLNDLTFDLTSQLIDKRFKGSKNFIQTGSTSGKMPYKKSTNETERTLHHLTMQQSLKSRITYNNSISSYNKMLQDYKIKSTFKLLESR